MSILAPNPPRFVTAAVTATYNDLIVGNATAAGFAVTLPPAALGLAPIRIKKDPADATANALTVTAAGADLIDGSATYALTAVKGCVELVPYTGMWLIVAKV